MASAPPGSRTERSRSGPSTGGTVQSSTMLIQRHEHVVPATSAWIHGRVTDVVLGWCWLPVALIVHGAGSSVTRIQTLMGLVFLVSFAHQPLTLGLVYGDTEQRQLHRRLYRWAPLVAVIAIAIGLNVSLAIVGVVAGLWNAEHTLMQRYGVIRIYGRKAGDDHGRIEKPMLVVWLLTALLFLGAYADLPALGARIGVDQTNAHSIESLDRIASFATALFWFAAIASVVLAWRWIRAERMTAASVARSAKWIYAAGTLGLVVAVMIDPIAGIAGYVAAHAVEYFAIVHRSLVQRSWNADVAPSAIVMATSNRPRRIVAYIAYFAIVGAFIAGTYRLWDGRVYGFAILFFGALHILYDGLVWKLRRPTVAARFGIVSPM